MVDQNHSAVASLIAHHAADNFLTKIWPDKYFAFHGDKKHLPECLRAQTLSDVDTLSRVYRGSLRFARGKKNPRMIQIDDIKASSLYQMGLTVCFDDVGLYLPQADVFLRKLENELGINEGSARMSVFASPIGDGVPYHYDAQDVFCVQLQGTKRFYVGPVNEVRNPWGVQYGPGTIPCDIHYPQVGNGFPHWKHAEIEEIDMKPGSVLFMPRGTWHHSVANDDSLSVSIIIDPPTAAECVLEQLRLMLLQDEKWRRPLYGLWGSGEMRNTANTQAVRLLKELPKIASTQTVDDLLLHTLTDDQRYMTISPDSRFQKIPTARLEIQEPSSNDKDGRYMVHVKSGDAGTEDDTAMRMEIYPESLPIFQWLIKHDTPFSAKELHSQFSKFPFDEIKTILGVVSKGGLLKMLWFKSMTSKPVSKP